MDDSKPKAGDLLLSDPYLMDPTFKKSVIVLCEHEADLGSVGFVLNRPINIKLNKVIDGFPDYEGKVYYGGPVAPDTLHYIHTKGDILNDSVSIGKGIYWGGDFEQLKFLMNRELIKQGDIKFFIGYSGWSEGQLDQEMKERSWLKAELHFNYVFGNFKSNLWKRIMTNKGSGFSVLANTTDSISLN